MLSFDLIFTKAKMEIDFKRFSMLLVELENLTLNGLVNYQWIYFHNFHTGNNIWGGITNVLWIKTDIEPYFYLQIYILTFYKLTSCLFHFISYPMWSNQLLTSPSFIFICKWPSASTSANGFIFTIFPSGWRTDFLGTIGS